MFTLLTRLFRLAAVPPVPPTFPAAPGPAAETDVDETPLGCGWFDSSHDLLSGVTVLEGIIVVDNTVARPS